MKSYFQFFGVILCTTLLLLKVSVPHSYSHDDTDEIQDCEVCIISIENQQQSFDFTYCFEILPEAILVQPGKFISYTTIFLSSEIEFQSFGRPPPSMLS